MLFLKYRFKEILIIQTARGFESDSKLLAGSSMCRYSGKKSVTKKSEKCVARSVGGII